MIVLEDSAEEGTLFKDQLSRLAYLMIPQGEKKVQGVYQTG